MEDDQPAPPHQEEEQSNSAASIHAVAASNPQALLRQQAHSPAHGVPVGQNLNHRFVAAAAAPPQQAAGPSWNSVRGAAIEDSSINNSSNENNDISLAASSVASTRYNNQRSTVDVELRRMNIQQPFPQRPPTPPQQQQQQQQRQPLMDDTDLVPEREMENDNLGQLSTGWSEVEVSQDNQGIPPSPRSLHAAALLNGVLYVFGGYDGTQRVNTFHAFSFAEKRWSPVLPSAHSAPPPSPRDRHVAFVFGNSFYVHGGFDGRSRVSDMFAFDFSTMTWREINTSASAGRVPSARHSHSAVVHGHSLYIAFGYDGSYKSDIHMFDFLQSRWSAVPAAGRRPRARYRATAVAHKKYMVVYGGHDGVRHLSDTNIFDLETQTWSTLVTEGPAPVPRDSHVSVIHGSSMFVFAGSSGTAMNDFHELQLPSSSSTALATSTPARWRSVHTSARAFQPRHRFCHVGVVHDGSLYCFGGYDGRDRLNDFVRFDFTVYDLSFEVPPSTIISDFRNMINDSTLSDVTFIVEGQPVFAHKLMLMRSSYFQALFLGNMKESRMSEIPIAQVRRPVFLQIIEYLYTDQLKIPLSSAMELFEAADLFCINRLKTMCEKRMLQSITVDNAAAIFHAADMHAARALRQKAKKYILSHFEEVSKSSCFEEMGRNNIELVFELLQSR